MKTKLISLTWRGSASVDPRFSAPMLSWSVADICNRETHDKLSVGIENGVLEAYNCDFEQQFGHPVKFVVGVCRVVARHSINGKQRMYADFSAIPVKSDEPAVLTIVGPHHGFVYLLKDPRDPLLHIHLFEGDCLDEMTELLHQLRDPSQKLGGSVGSIPSSFIGDTNSLGSSGAHSTPASNLKLSEAVRTAHHDGSPSVVSAGNRLISSKSYNSGLSHSAGTVHTPSAAPPVQLDISPNNTQFFEVMYVGKIKVSHKRVPYTFIDDALPKFKAYDAQKSRGSTLRKNSEHSSTDGGSSTRPHKESPLTIDYTPKELIEVPTTLKIVETSDEAASTDSRDTTATEASIDEPPNPDFQERILNTQLSEENKENSLPKNRKILMRGTSQVVMPVQFDQANSLPLPPPPPKVAESVAEEAPPRLRDRSMSLASIPTVVEQNRTMVFLIGKSEMRLISPDRKQVLLYKDFKDVASCAQGHKNADHFGIICREPNSEGYIGYVFKCQSDTVADDIVGSISQAFQSCTEQKNRERSQIFSCEHCPMLWYHKLCTDIEGLSDKKTQTMIFRRVEVLSEEEQTVIMAKYYGAEEMADHGLAEQNQFMMMLLRAHCESRQQRHVHDTAENRSEFLNQYLGGSTIFMKAKRSLTSSFDHLLKRKNSKDDFGTTSKESVSRETLDNISKKSDSEKSEVHSMSNRPRAASIGVTNFTRTQSVEPLKSPMMDIFIKVGNSPKDKPNHAGSWRQEILNRVVTPSKKIADRVDAADLMSPRRTIQTRRAAEKRTAAELRLLWRTAIRQTILLHRMEKENARLQARHNEHELKKIKLDYVEIIPCEKPAIDRWEELIDREPRISNKCDPKMLLQAIRAGVPRSKRGEVWLYLTEQFSMNMAPVDVKKFPNFNTPYKVLLKSLTEHQHAIFIDLGRTFPNHKYYKAALGIGQLSLFNILKAYSILDPELGYCQGLGFICGVLLLHCDEEEAFNLLKHLMFRRQMRTKYLPDMRQFQLQLYQLSRLIRDHLPDLYAWLDQNEVSPTLYAAPWILTVFSSQFALGFVNRVFDILFLESPEVIFKVSIALLDVHKEELMKRDNFEEIMDYLKNVVPKMDADTLDTILKKVFTMDIRKQLSEYQVEYNVLQEEISTTNHTLESLKRTNENNQHLETQLQFAQSSIVQLEKTRSAQLAQIQALQSQVQSLEVTVHSMGSYVSNLADRNHSIELPGEIRRICQQVEVQARSRKAPVFVDRKIGKSVSVNAQLGFPLKVLEEMNECSDSPHSSPKGKTPFFENTYQMIRQQQQTRPNRLVDLTPTLVQSATLPSPSTDMRLPEYVEKAIQSMSSPKQSDSGIATPVSPPSSVLSLSPPSLRLLQPPQGIESAVMPESPNPVDYINVMHPLGNCEDVNFSFNGTTTQLKSFRPTHSHHVSRSATHHNDVQNGTDTTTSARNGRS